MQCLARGASGIKGIGIAFRIMDEKHNGELDFDEFVDGLNNFGCHLDSDDVIVYDLPLKNSRCSSPSSPLLGIQRSL